MKELLDTFYAFVDRHPWLFLLGAGFFEICWAITLKLSDGYKHLIPTLLTIPLALLSAGLLAMAMRMIPMSVAYMIWVGIGAAGVAVIGFFYFGDRLSALQYVCIGLIVLGIIGLKLSGKATS